MSTKKSNQKPSEEQTSSVETMATELVDRHFAAGHDCLFDICKQAKVEVDPADWNHEKGTFAIGKEAIVSKYIAPALAKWEINKK